MKNAVSYFTYIVECSDKTLYSGICKELEKRIKQHNGALKGGAKYTRSRRPVILRYFKEFETKSTAMQEEAKLKKLDRSEKIRLCRVYT